MTSTSVEAHLLSKSEVEAFTKTVKEIIADDYVRILAKLLKAMDIDASCVGFSLKELGAAIHEANVDISALMMRRKPRKGISHGKIAGIIAFRLARCKILHLDEDTREHSWSFIIQDLVAIIFVTERVIRVNIPENFIMELAYQIARRHANQETLGLCFDILRSDFANPSKPSST
jgi:hypothetical protein